MHDFQKKYSIEVTSRTDIARGSAQKRACGDHSQHEIKRSGADLRFWPECMDNTVQKSQNRPVSNRMIKHSGLGRTVNDFPYRLNLSPILSPLAPHLAHVKPARKIPVVRCLDVSDLATHTVPTSKRR